MNPLARLLLSYKGNSLGLCKVSFPHDIDNAGRRIYPLPLRDGSCEEQSRLPGVRTGFCFSETLVPLSLETAQTLALGFFNPHIISPSWLVKQRICDDKEVELRLMAMSQGVGFRFKDVEWQIDLQSLMTASTKKSCGELAAQLLEKLHHTPVRAVGNNFHYSGTMADWGEGPLPMLGDKSWDALADVGKTEQLRWMGTFSQDSVRIEVTLGQSTDAIAALFNFHRDTKNAAEAIAAARQFDLDSKKSRELLEKLFQQGNLP